MTSAVLTLIASSRLPVSTTSSTVKTFTQQTVSLGNRIVDGRVKDYIFNGIDSTSTNRCFVQYDPQREEIYFCYKSADDLSEFTNGDGCNRAAVFNYINNTWSFLDLPNVYFGTTANVDTVATYDSVPPTATYDSYGGTYASQDSGFYSARSYGFPARYS